MDRSYFYKTSAGKTRRLYYCTFCGAGPFREEDLGKGTFYLNGAYNQSVCTCRSCDFMKNPKRPRPPVQVGTPRILIANVITTARVMAGQVWRDKDRRRPRTVIVDRIDGDNAYYKSGNRRIRVSVKRLLDRWELNPKGVES